VATRAFVRAAVDARRSHVALRRGDVRALATGPRWIALERSAEGRRAVVAINAGEAPAAIDLGAAGGRLRLLALPGMDGSLEATTVRLPPLGGIVLVDG
jgi:hypothetical protein